MQMLNNCTTKCQGRPQNRSKKSFEAISLFILIFISGYVTAQEVQFEVAEHALELDPVDNIFSNGVHVNHAKNNGLHVASAGKAGLHIAYSYNDAIRIAETQLKGIHMENIGGTAIQIDTATIGMHLKSADFHGIHIEEAGYHGIWVEDAPLHSLIIEGTKNQSNSLTGHITLLRNKSAGSGPDVLALQVEATDPGGGANFITFYDGDEDILGEVQGNGSGGISYTSAGADYAEYLPKLNSKDEFQPGDIVGIQNGKISHHTIGAAQVMVVTDQAAVLGNRPKDSQGYEMVSFLGQIPVRVSGPVKAGDWIVADDKENGIGKAVSAEEIKPEHQIVGQAWESCAHPGLRRINTLVGRDAGMALAPILRCQQATIEEQQSDIVNLKATVEQFRTLLKYIVTKVDDHPQIGSY